MPRFLLLSHLFKNNIYIYMLLASNLSFSRKDRIIFQKLYISLPPKKIIHIQGRNGIGKTTLIKVLTNLLIPLSGEIYWNGKNIRKNLNEFYCNLNYIIDKNTSKNELTVRENINYWIKLFSSKVKLNEINSILDILNLSKYKYAPVNLLSSGEIKKLELCRLVIERKKLWILDEPYIGIDQSTIELVNETFKNHIDGGGMIVFSSHYNPELQNIEKIRMEDYANN